jgi:hypothetical protein
MSDAAIIAICAAIPPTLMATLAWWKAKHVHRELNSRLTQWKEETAKATIASNAASKAEGVKEAEEKASVPIKLPLIAATCLLLTGCSTTNITKLVGALAKDPATVAVSVQSVYGTVYILRTGNTNQQIILGPISVK